MNGYTAIAGEKANVVAEDLAALIAKSRVSFFSLSTNWSSTIVGSASATQRHNDIFVETGTTNPSSAVEYSLIVGWSQSGSQDFFDWTKKTYLYFGIYRADSVASAITRVQLRSTIAGGTTQLAEAGIGLEIANYAMTGESYGTTRGTVSLGTSLTDKLISYILIILYPADKVEFYVDGVLKGTISGTASQLPVATALAASLIFSLQNLAASSVTADFIQPRIWQVR